MGTAEKKEEFYKALKIGMICVGTYLASYIFRNLLSVLTPLMLDDAALSLSKSDISEISSIYMICYAAGQLVFGLLGDYVKPKYMVAGGLILAGLGILLFPGADGLILKILTYGMLGLGLSALRGPLVRVISENNTKQHSRFLCAVLSCASFLGPAIAGLMAIFIPWKSIYYLCAGLAFLFAAGSFTLLTVLEKKGIIVPRKAEIKEKTSGILGVFRAESFIAYMLIGMVVEINASAIDFWIPTYINEYLGFPEDVSGVIFSVVSFAKAFSTFLCLGLLKLFHDRDMHLNVFTFGLGALLLIIMAYVKVPWLNIGIYLVSRVLTTIGSATIWSVYIPGLAKTGKVSSANGILDCSGYAAAAIANLFIPGIMEAFGWRGTIWSWALVSLFALAVVFCELAVRYQKQHRNTQKGENRL